MIFLSFLFLLAITSDASKSEEACKRFMAYKKCVCDNSYRTALDLAQDGACPPYEKYLCDRLETNISLLGSCRFLRLTFCKDINIKKLKDVPVKHALEGLELARTCHAVISLEMSPRV